MKTYSETVEWLYSQLPVYQRSGAGSGYKIDLDKTHRLMELLDHPERSFRSVHVAGTNGKGSVSHMTASILQEAGYKVGLYTSPHLRDFRERVRINGEMITEDEVISFVEKHKSHFIGIGLSFFEMTVGLAFDRFRAHQVEIAVVEVGMGGRLDSTNVIVPEVSIITNIGLDHTAFLGTTLEAIAAEKAGIIKRDVPVIIGERQAETTAVFEDVAQRMNAPVQWAEDVVREEYESDLKGKYQVHNIKAAVAGIRTLRFANITEEHVEAGLKNVIRNTHLAGRWFTLSTDPPVICDTAHNPAGLRYVVEQISETPHERLHMVWGMVNDKDITSVLQMLPKEAEYYFCKPDIPRGLPADELWAEADKAGLRGKTYPSVEAALRAAKESASGKDLIFVGGSTFVVAEVV